MTLVSKLWPLFLAAALLLAGNGLQGTLIALRAQAEGFSTIEVGLMGTAYYLGFLGACRFATGLIREVGHIRVFAALASLAAAAALMHVLVLSSGVWIVLRFLTGFCFAGLFMVMESWINDATPNKYRAQTLSLYATVDLATVTLSQFLIPVVGIDGFQIFALLSIFFGISLVPIALSSRSRPQIPGSLKFKLTDIWQISPIACIGCFAIGLTNAAFRLVGPLYGTEVGLDISGVAIFMSAGIIGGAVLLYPLGYLSDRFDRRWIMIITSLGACAAGLSLALLQPAEFNKLYAGAFCFGAFALPLYSLSVAHANDMAKPGQHLGVSAGLLFFFALGASMGPSVASLVMRLFDASAFFTFTSTVHGLLAIAALWRMVRRPHIVLPSRAGFVALLRTSPMFYRLAHKSRPQKPEAKSGTSINKTTDSEKTA